MRIRPGDVVFMKGYQFSEDKRASNHPAIVLFTKGSEAIVAICTDANNRNKHVNCIEVNYTAARLSKPSVAICSKAGVILISCVTKIIGKATTSDINKLIDIITADYLKGKVKIFEMYS